MSTVHNYDEQDIGPGVLFVCVWALTLLSFTSYHAIVYLFAPACDVRVEDRTTPNKTLTVVLSSGQSSGWCDVGAMREVALNGGKWDPDGVEPVKVETAQPVEVGPEDAQPDTSEQSEQ